MNQKVTEGSLTSSKECRHGMYHWSSVNMFIIVQHMSYHLFFNIYNTGYKNCIEINLKKIFIVIYSTITEWVLILITTAIED